MFLMSCLIGDLEFCEVLFLLAMLLLCCECRCILSIDTVDQIRYLIDRVLDIFICIVERDLNFFFLWHQGYYCRYRCLE